MTEGRRAFSARVRTAALLLLVATGACGRGEPASAPSATQPPGPGASSDDDDATSLAPCAVDTPVLGPGLTVERWPIATEPTSGPPCIDVVRADADRYALRILSAADEAGARTATAWRDTFHLTAVTNAGMFHPSGDPVGLIVSEGRERSRDNRKMSGYLAFDPVTTAEPPVEIAGRDCPGFDLAALRARYHSIVQSYRLLGCDGEALPWQDPRPYPAAALGIDRAGRLVLLHTRARVPMAALSRALATHDLTGALFLEGSGEASLIARGPDGELALVGDPSQPPPALPNVIALLPR